jgi:hypothetical protein
MLLAKFFGCRFGDRPNDLFTGKEVRHNPRIQTNFPEAFYLREIGWAILLFPHQVHKRRVVFQPIAANLEEPIFAYIIAQPLHLFRSSAIH